MPDARKDQHMTVGEILDFVKNNLVSRDALIMIKTPIGLVQASVISDGVATLRGNDKTEETVLAFGLDPVTERMMFDSELFGDPDTTKQ